MLTNQSIVTFRDLSFKYTPQAICLCVMVKLFIFIVNWNGSVQKRKLIGYVKFTVQPRFFVKYGRAICMAAGFFTRTYGGWFSYIVMAIAAAMRSAPLTSWRRHGIFWRRPRKKKCIRLFMLMLNFMTTENLIRYFTAGVSLNDFGLFSIISWCAEIKLGSVVANIMLWTWSTMRQSFCLWCYGTCAVPAEVTVVLLVYYRMNRFKHAFSSATAVFFLYLNHGISYRAIEYLTLEEPQIWSVRMIFTSLWMHSCILLGGFCHLIRITCPPSISSRNSYIAYRVYKMIGNWSCNTKVSIILSRLIQRILFTTYSKYVQSYGSKKQIDADDSIISRGIHFSTSITIASLRKTILREELFRTNSCSLRQPPRTWDDPAFAGWHDSESLCIVRGDSNALLCLAMTTSGVLLGSWKALIMGSAFGVFGMALRLLPVSPKLTKIASEHFIHMGSLSLGVMHIPVLGVACGVNVMKRRCTKILEASHVMKLNISRAAHRLVGNVAPKLDMRYKSILSCIPNVDNTITSLSLQFSAASIERSKFDPSNNDSVVEAPLFSTQTPTAAKNQVRGESKTQAKRISSSHFQETKGHRKSTRFCCVCYDDVSSEKGILCSNGVTDGRHPCLSVHFTCDACLERHIFSEFPQDTPNVAKLIKLGRGDGGLYCPCHPGKPSSSDYIGESKIQREDIGCCAPAFDMTILAQHVSEVAFKRCLSIQLYVREQRIFEETTAKWQIRYDRALKLIKMQKIKQDRSILEEQLKRQFPDARQCLQCGHGPVLHFACSNLSTHHGEKHGIRGKINNACVKCGWFARSVDSWPKWNGQIGEDLDVSDVDVNALKSETKAALPQSRDETATKAAARRARQLATEAERDLALAQMRLRNLDRRAHDNDHLGRNLLPQRLTPDLRRLMTEGVLTQEQAVEMMTQVDVDENATETESVYDLEDLKRNICRLTLTAMLLENRARKAEAAADAEAEAKALGDDGLISAFDFSAAGSMFEDPEQTSAKKEMTTGIYEVYLLCAHMVSLMCITALCSLCRSLAWSIVLFVAGLPSTTIIIIILAAFGAALVCYDKQETIQMIIDHAVSFVMESYPSVHQEA